MAKAVAEAKSSGGAARASPLDMAHEALRLAETDPRRALELARQVRAWAPGAGPLAHGVAAWAAGRSQRHLGRYRESQAYLESAVDLLRQTADRSATAQAALHLALERIDSGRFDEAIALIGEAENDLSGPDKARAAAQRALALQRGGRAIDALEDWELALETFTAAGMPVEEAICRESRGLVHAYRGELAQAESDLLAAETTFARCGEEIRAVEAVHNRGFVAARRGDLPRALSLFDQAQSRAAEIGVVRPAMLVDRVEVYLQAGLTEEAMGLAQEAVRSLEQGGLGADVPEACLLAARACEQAGQLVAAVEWAQRAVDLFRDQRRPRWEVLARFAALRAEAALRPTARGLEKRLASASDELRRWGWRAQAAEADVRLADVLIARGRSDDAAPLVARLVHRLPTALPLARLEVRLVQARLAQARQEWAGANRALAGALRSLRAYQSTLGSIELRAAGGGQAEKLMAAGVALARSSKDPAAALWWTEAVRSAQEAGPGRQEQAGPELAQALESLREVMALQAREGIRPPEAAALRRRQAALEEVVRRRSRHASGPGLAERTLSAAQLARALGPTVLVELASVGGALNAVLLRAGRCTLVELGALPRFRELAGRLRFALQASIRSAGAGLGAAQEAAAQMEKFLFGRLDLPAGAELVLVPDGVGASVPWGALARIAGSPVVVAFSASGMCRRQPPPLSRTRRPRVVVLAGPGLAHAEEEADAVGAAWGTARVLSGAQAAFSTAKAHLARADVVHIAAHGSFRDGNALLSTVHLYDGPLTGGELAQVTSGARLVVLSCCDIGMPDSSGVGLTRLIAEAGASAVLASVTPVSDRSSVPFVSGLHRAVAAGMSPASALVAARQGLVDRADWASALGFICFGGGLSPLVPVGTGAGRGRVGARRRSGTDVC